MRLLVLLGTLVLALLTGPPPAQAAPKIGPVTGLAASVSASSGQTSTVAARWDALATATAYEVKVVGPGGTVLSVVRQTGTDWSGAVTTRPGSGSVQVVPLSGNRRGRTASQPVTFPDRTAPTGSFTVAASGQQATITQTMLSDDATVAGSILRELRWDDGDSFQPWASGTTVSHTYATVGRYVPQVRLTDTSGNARTLSLSAVVLGDTTAPTASYTHSAGPVWTRFTAVTLGQTSLSDDYSPGLTISRTVAWGDGVTQAWATGTTIKHAYRTAGSYTPQVTVTDEAGNSATYPAPAVTVTDDTLKPTVTVTKPKVKRAYVSSWVTLKGRTADAQTGVRLVRVKAIEKRATGWYAFRPGTGTWVRTTSLKRAWSAARLMSVKPSSTGAWQGRLKGLRKGDLRLRVTAVDRASNPSAITSVRQVLRY